MIYNINYREDSKIKGKRTYPGESIEEKVRRILDDKEPIKDSGQQLYSNSRNEGVMAETNIRTDRFDVAVEAMDIAQKAKNAQRDAKAQKIGEKAKEGMAKEAGENNQSKE